MQDNRAALRGQSWTRSGRRRGQAVMALAAGVLAAVVGTAMPGQALASTTGSAAKSSPAGSYIVRARPGQLAELAQLLASRHLKVQRQIGIIDADVVILPAGVADQLRRDPRVASVTANAAVQLLVDRGADLEAHDYGSRDTVNGAMKGWTWIALHYAQGLARVGVQSAIAHPETEALIKKLMRERGLTIPPDITGSICLTKGVQGCQ